MVRPGRLLPGRARRRAGRLPLDEGAPGEPTHDAEPIGEVYVVGVAPEARGWASARRSRSTGLHHLRWLGLSTSMLYVDGDNAPAVALYDRLGFTVVNVDVSTPGPPVRRDQGEVTRRFTSQVPP